MTPRKILKHFLLTALGTILFASVLSLFKINLLEWPVLFVIPAIGFVAGVVE